MHILILLLILLTPVGSESEDTSHQENCMPGQCYQILEDALLSEPENLYKLQLAFFPAEKASGDRLAFRVCIHLAEETKPFVDFSNDLEWCQGGSCSSDGSKGCWSVSWSSSLLYGAITRQLFGLDNTMSVVLYETAHRDYNSIIRNYYSSLELYINNTIPCSGIEAFSLDESVNILATWFKAYARAHSKPGSWKNEDKGYVTRHYGYYDVESVDSYNFLHIFRVILLSGFIIMNITAQLFVVILVPRYYCRVIKVLSERGEHVVNSFWSLAIVAIISNLVLFVASFLFWYKFDFAPAVTQACPIKSLCSNPTIYLDANISYSFRIATIFLALFVDLLVAIWTPKFQPLHCCSSTVWSKVAQIFVLWNILILLQFHIMSVIPISILIMLAPWRTISAIAVYAIFILLFILTVAHVLKMCRHIHSQKSRAKSGVFCTACEFIVQLCAILALFLLILIVLSTYVLLQLWGVGRSNNSPEFVWSLVPPVLLSLLGWYVKKRFFRENRSSGMSHSELQYTLLQEASTDDETEESV